MVCYMLIMNMLLWITIYLRNKWCLNLEPWILGSGQTLAYDSLPSVSVFNLYGTRNMLYFYYFDWNYYHLYNRLVSALPAIVDNLRDFLKLSLTHRGRVSYVCIGKLDLHKFR